jgi:DNA repair photolyase
MHYKIIHAKSILVSEPFSKEFNLNTYRGCEHACNYCYARANKYLIHKDEKDFDQTIFVKINAADLLRKELAKLKKRCMIFLNSASDPYQICEEKYGITRKVLEVINEYKFPCHIMTKSNLILRDLDLLKNINENAFCTVSFTITTFNKRLLEIFEPRAPEPEKRLEAMNIISENGIYTGVFFMPIIPYITDSEENIENVVRKSKEKGAKYVIYSTLTLRDVQRERFMNLLKENFPDIFKTYEKLYGENQSPNKDYQKMLEKRLDIILKKHLMPKRIIYPLRGYIQKRLYEIK